MIQMTSGAGAQLHLVLDLRQPTTRLIKSCHEVSRQHSDQTEMETEVVNDTC